MIADMDSSRAHSGLSRKANSRLARDFGTGFLLTSRTAREIVAATLGVTHVAHEFLDTT
jgi:hypothetical protein